jgi:hypothetical protein
METNNILITITLVFLVCVVIVSYLKYRDSKKEEQEKQEKLKQEELKNKIRDRPKNFYKKLGQALCKKDWTVDSKFKNKELMQKLGQTVSDDTEQFQKLVGNNLDITINYILLNPTISIDDKKDLLLFWMIIGYPDIVSLSDDDTKIYIRNPENLPPVGFTKEMTVKDFQDKLFDFMKDKSLRDIDTDKLKNINICEYIV